MRVRSGSEVLIVDLKVVDLHALCHHEGMGEPAFPPQGVGTSVFLVGTGRGLKRGAGGISL